MQWNRLFANRTAFMRRSAVRELLKLTAKPDIISFAGGLPAPELFPVDAIREAADRVLRERGQKVLQYSETEGIADLRDWIAGQLTSHRTPLTRHNILIVSGSQQALDLIGRIFLDPGDRVLVENPTYLALLSAWRPLGVDIRCVPTDDDGLCVDAVEAHLAQPVKLIYCMPNFQNPQGITLVESRRRRLVELAAQAGAGIIEDNPYGELRFSDSPLPHLFHCAAGLPQAPGHKSRSPVIYVGTFSKTLAPGLRIGWVAASEEVIDCLVRAKQAADLHTSTLNQHIVLELVRADILDQHVRTLQEAYRERRDTMLGALKESMPPSVSWTNPDGGMFLFVRLPPDMNATQLLDRALERKVAFVPGEEFHLNGTGLNTLRLNFSNASPGKIQEGIKRLAETITLHLP